MQLLYNACDIPDFKDTKALFTSRYDDIDITEYCYALFSQPECFQPTVQLFNDLVDEFVSRETVNKFKDTPIKLAMRMLWISEPKLYDEWKKVIRHIIGLGADISNGQGSEGTLLDDIMNLVARPVDSLYLGREWLDVLSKSNVDLRKYLRTESSLRFEEIESSWMLRPDFRSDYRPRGINISEEPPSVSWDWYIDPAGPAYELLTEFKDFGPIPSDFIYFGYLDDDDLFVEEEDQNWPFFFSLWQDRLRKGWRDPMTLKFGRLVEARFENRQRKKAKKLANDRKNFRSLKMPGSWIE